MYPSSIGAAGAESHAVQFYWFLGGCVAVYLILISVTLLVALFASGAQARRAQEILGRLLDSLDRLSGRGR